MIAVKMKLMTMKLMTKMMTKMKLMTKKKLMTKIKLMTWKIQKYSLKKN